MRWRVLIKNLFVPGSVIMGAESREWIAIVIRIDTCPNIDQWQTDGPPVREIKDSEWFRDGTAETEGTYKIFLGHPNFMIDDDGSGTRTYPPNPFGHLLTCTLESIWESILVDPQSDRSKLLLANAAFRMTGRVQKVSQTGIQSLPAPRHPTVTQRQHYARTPSSSAGGRGANPPPGGDRWVRHDSSSSDDDLRTETPSRDVPLVTSRPRPAAVCSTVSPKAVYALRMRAVDAESELKSLKEEYVRAYRELEDNTTRSEQALIASAEQRLDDAHEEMKRMAESMAMEYEANREQLLSDNNRLREMLAARSDAAGGYLLSRELDARDETIAHLRRELEQQDVRPTCTSPTQASGGGVQTEDARAASLYIDGRIAVKNREDGALECSVCLDSLLASLEKEVCKGCHRECQTERGADGVLVSKPRPAIAREDVEEFMEWGVARDVRGGCTCDTPQAIEKVVQSADVTLLKCGHAFHKTCIRQLCLSQDDRARCPFCNEPIVHDIYHAHDGFVGGGVMNGAIRDAKSGAQMLVF